MELRLFKSLKMEKKRLDEARREGGEEGRTGSGAPFASVEDLSDEGSPPPGAEEGAGGGGGLTAAEVRPPVGKLEVPGSSRGGPGGGGDLAVGGGGPPRIDISRASSSSHHEDSSPERELFAGEGGGSVKVGLGFSEDMALELRSSTEELDFHEPEPERRSKKKKLQQQQAVIVTRYEAEESEKAGSGGSSAGDRKDSGCSEGGLLYIGGGRSSRLSSIGSGGSGVSAGSAVSHLSAASNYSRASRCSSPHRMLLETSFCGPKPIPTLSLEAEYPPSESVEAALLKRKTDPAGAVLPNCLEVAGGKPRRTSSERTVRPSPAVQPAVRSSSARAVRKPLLKKRQEDENLLVRIIPLHSSDEEDNQAGVEEPEEEEDKEKKVDDFEPENGGIYIPLKGPMIDTRRPATAEVRKEPPEVRKERREERRERRERAEERRERREGTRSPNAPPPQSSLKKESRGPELEMTPAGGGRGPSEQTRSRRKQSDEIEETELFKFISLHGDDDEEIQNRRNNQNVLFKSLATEPSARQYMEMSREWPKPRPRTPEPPKPGLLELEKRKNGRSLGQIPRDDSRTPSPASSFTRGNLFRRSSDSSGSSKKSLSSCDSKTKKDHRNKSMFTSLFKKNVKETPVRKTQSERVPIDPKLTNVEYKFKQEENVIDKDTIIIPLHSPDEVVEPLIRYEPEKEQNDLGRDRTSPTVHQPQTTESQRTSLEIQKNIVVVDVINEDRKDQPTPREEPRTPVEPPRKAPQPEIKRKVDELEVYDFEPRVRRSSSVCSRETEVVLKKDEGTSSKEDKEIQVDERDKPIKTIKVDEMVQVQETEERKERRSADTDDTLSKSESVETCREASQETVIENTLTRDEEAEGGGGPPPPQSPGHEGDILSSLLQDEEVESLIKREDDSENNLRLLKSSGAGGAASRGASQERRSSESEQESSAKDPVAEETDEERKGLFLQADSVEEELPYVPTTLPQERSVAMPIIPVRQRGGELVKTYPVERPRSTTPIQPANLEGYAAFHECLSSPRASQQEKMQITLPRTESLGRKGGSGGRGGGGEKGSPPPPLPPRGAPPQQPTTPAAAPPPPLQWVAFDEPERRRTPRRITTLPLAYVNPEECTCECHEAQHGGSRPPLQPATKCSKPQHCPKQSRTEKEKKYRTADR